MFDKEQFEILDFGDGKKLERFAGVEVVRDCPAAIGVRAERIDWLKDTGQWSHRMIYSKSRKHWRFEEALSESWQISHHGVIFNLKPTPFGHLGVFCEQAENWDWLIDLPFELTGKRALNLFAYTGGSTLALAAAGANVVHIDSAKNVVNWARANADSSGLGAAPIRWIVDDAVKFVRREIKRGNKYDIIVADPPAVGHAGNKMTWKFERDIEPLVESLAKLVSEDFMALLLTCHSAGTSAEFLASLAKQPFQFSGGVSGAGPLDLVCDNDRRLNCGQYFRWHR